MGADDYMTKTLQPEGTDRTGKSSAAAVGRKPFTEKILKVGELELTGNVYCFPSRETDKTERSDSSPFSPNEKAVFSRGF
jgi:hypothetical protein